jgi:hypothetical protein
MKVLEPSSEPVVDPAGDAFGHANGNLRVVWRGRAASCGSVAAIIGLARPHGSSLGGVIRPAVPLIGGDARVAEADIAAKSVTANGPQIEIRADVAAFGARPTGALGNATTELSDQAAYRPRMG